MKALPFVAMIVLALILAACSTPPGKIEIQTVHVPVPVSCKPDIPAREGFPDTNQALQSAPTIFEQTQLLLAGRDLRTARIIDLEAALKACE